MIKIFKTKLRKSYTNWIVENYNVDLKNYTFWKKQNIESRKDWSKSYGVIVKQSLYSIKSLNE